jgi:hypothetical protein
MLCSSSLPLGVPNWVVNYTPSVIELGFIEIIIIITNTFITIITTSSRYNILG